MMQNLQLKRYLEDFQGNLKVVRERLDLSVNQMCEYLDVTRQTINNFESQKNALSLSSALAISAVFDFATKANSDLRGLVLSSFLIGEEDMFKKLIYNPEDKRKWAADKSLVDSWMDSFLTASENTVLDAVTIKNTCQAMGTMFFFWDILQISAYGFRHFWEDIAGECQKTFDMAVWFHEYSNIEKSIQMNNLKVKDIVRTMKNTPIIQPTIWGREYKSQVFIEALVEYARDNKLRNGQCAVVTNDFALHIELHARGFHSFLLNRDGSLFDVKDYIRQIERNIKEGLYINKEDGISGYMSAWFK
jgi:DNA-binding XRE family transcriptional regulator